MSSFKRMVSAVAFNPGMFDQLAFYSRRLKQEESVRRLGLVLIIFTMFLQLFAAMAPPERSLAASNNDVIYGGVDTISQLRSKYYGQADVRALYNRFGIVGSEIEAGKVKNVSFNFRSQGLDGTRTVGRINFASTQDLPLGPYAGTTFYSRSAGEWSGSTPAYEFGTHKGTDNKYYKIWVLKDCGNIAYQRVGSVDIITPGTPVAQPGPTPVIPPTPTPSPAPTTTPVVVPTSPIAPQVACTSLTADKTSGIGSLKVKFTAQHTASPPETFIGYTFNFGDGTSIRQTATTAEYTYSNHTDQPATYTAFLIIHSTLGDKRSPLCEVTISLSPETCSEDSDCLAPKRTKRVKNITQNLTSAKSLITKAQAGDIMEYSLITSNRNDIALTNYKIEDYIGDLLDYSNVDLAFLKSQGGSFSAEKKTITWLNQTIAANSEVKKEFRVKLKNPLPSTNRPNATSPDFDCKMQNGYGNEVMVSVNCSPVKTIEQLPNTGPGTALVAAFSLSTLSGYFVARARLLAKELGIVKRGWRS